MINDGHGSKNSDSRVLTEVIKDGHGSKNSDRRVLAEVIERGLRSANFTKCSWNLLASQQLDHGALCRLFPIRANGGH